MLNKGLGAVIFNHTTLLGEGFAPNIVDELRGLLRWLREARTKVVVVSTKKYPVRERLERLGLPPPNLVLTLEDVRKRKGSPIWVTEAASRLGLSLKDVVYVGDTEREWRTAINARVFYLHAGWSGRKDAGLLRGWRFRAPSAMRLFIEKVLAPAPMWTHRWRYPSGDTVVKIRVLLPSSVQLRGSEGLFSLVDVFAREKQINVGGLPANAWLVTLAVASLLREGLFAPDEKSPLVAPYPSSKPDRATPLFDEPLRILDAYLHGFYLPDLFIRVSPAEDKSLARWRARQGGGEADIDITNEANTLCLNDKYARRIEGRKVVVIDDFTTTGMSLEWARVLLENAGVREVILVAIGKYPKPHDVYVSPADPGVFPFKIRTYSKEEFEIFESVQLPEDEEAIRRVQEVFDAYAKGVAGQ